MTFNPTDKQQKAFSKVAKAIKSAQKEGLRFYAKSDSLVAYTKEADSYNNEVDFRDTLGNAYSQIPCISETGLIIDSGADDYPEFRTQEDEDKYS